MGLSATSHLREVLLRVNNDAQEARRYLETSAHPEARSAAGILRRTLNTVVGATHVRYAGGGAFDAVPPELFIVSVDHDKATVHALGTWDEARWGSLKSTKYGCQQIDQVKAALAPSAWIIRVLNHTGRTVATSSVIYSAAPATAAS